MNSVPILALSIGIGDRGGPVGLVVGLIVLAVVVLFVWEFGRGTAGSSTRLLRGIRRQRDHRKGTSRHARVHHHARTAARTHRGGE